MIRELIERFRAWVKQAREEAAALRERLAAAVRVILPAPEAVACAGARVVSSDGNVLNAGKRYRLLGGHVHAPIFSLYTFFGDR
jgi:phytoene/squalene synthetase